MFDISKSFLLSIATIGAMLGMHFPNVSSAATFGTSVKIYFMEHSKIIYLETHTNFQMNYCCI